MTERTLTIHVQFDPPISGYGGITEWTIGPLTSPQIDHTIERIEKAILGAGKLFKVEAGFTGTT